MYAFDPSGLDRLLSGEFRSAASRDQPAEELLAAWEAAPAVETADRMMWTDIETYLPDDLLAKVDIATMAYSVEGRSPLLDHRLMEFAASLPEESKLAHGGKAILKSSLRGWLPDEVIDRPKMGFAVPLAKWFRSDLAELPAEILLDAQALDRGYFKRSEIERLIEEHRHQSADHSLRLWTLLQLEMWHQEVADCPPVNSRRDPSVSEP